MKEKVIEGQVFPLASIRIDGDTQIRIGTNPDVVQGYAQDMLEGDAFPPIVVYYDGTHYWLSDGFHRYLAAQQIGWEEILTEVREGSCRDALLNAASANRKHGLSLSNKDKRRIVTMLLDDPEWSQWSDREIARRCGVSHMFVSNVRKEMTVNGLQSDTRLGADGRTYHTANIGTSTSNEQEHVEEPTSHLVEIGKSLLKAQILFEEQPSKEMDFDDPGLVGLAEVIWKEMRVVAQSYLAVGRIHNNLRKKRGYTLEEVFNEAWNEYHMHPDHVAQLLLYAESYSETPIEQVPEGTISAINDVVTEHLERRSEYIKNIREMNRKQAHEM